MGWRSDTPRLSRRARARLMVTFALWLVALAAPGGASAQVQAYGTNDFGGFRNILPPGASGFATIGELAAFLGNGARPQHNDDQLAMYSNLTTAAPGIRASQIPSFFKDATFGVRGGDVAGTQSPEPGVTIVRDKQFGVPHIYGQTRAALMFGIGYATAEDRLFFIDALRHAGQGNLAQFAGGANAGMDESVWSTTPYTPADLAKQVAYGVTHFRDGPKIAQDGVNYIAGINAYIAAAKQNPALMPGEYVGLGKSPELFTVDDLVSITALVGGIFGRGGGSQLSNAVLYEQLLGRFGRERRPVAGSPEGTVGGSPATLAPRGVARSARDTSGFASFLSFVDPNDPEAPTTAHGRSFPYQTLPLPGHAAQGSVALPDPGSVRYANAVVAGALPHSADNTASAASAPRPGSGLVPFANAGDGLLAFPRTDSNALLVSGARTASGHPIAVMGPQVGYFTPEILIDEDIHGPGIDAAGAAFPGVNLYVQLGHGRDYAWSATSAGQNIIDTFAVRLCNPRHGAISPGSDYYVVHRRCVQMETLTRSESWTPNPVDPTPAGSITFQTKRTAFGIVIARARVGGRPVVYTNLRSTYMHELNSAEGFAKFNDPAQIRNPRDFMNAAYNIGYTFNWFYADDKHIAYFNSGANPVRAPGTNPLFPTWSRFEWRGFDPSALTENQTPQSAHPQVVDQPVLTSWNNKQAPGYNDAATGQQYASVFRSQLLDNNINHYLHAGRGKLTLVDLINAMGNAGTQDLRGVEVLPYVLRILGHPRNKALARPIGELRAWVASGAHRINRAHPGASGNYEQTNAVRIMDAWWPLLVKAEFEPVLGPSLLSAVESNFPTNDQPGHGVGGTGVGGTHLGSAFDVGFYGIVQKDLRAALRDSVGGPLNRVYCGNGSLATCRHLLESSLGQATGVSALQVYPADGSCRAGDQECSDSVRFRPIGAITQPLIEWVNRPTFQQAVEIRGHGPR
jgi:acyl-homoserine lactone acylase PvdQ